MAIILGTRGSQLALAQAELAKQAVERLPERPEAIIRITATTGDRRLDINLSHQGPRSGTYLAGETEGQPTAVNEIVREGKSRGVTFLTAVAGTAVLGVQFAILYAIHDSCGEPVGICSFALDHSNLHVFCLSYRGRA